MKMEKGELIGFQGCLGYDYDPTTKTISINEEEAKIVRYIFKRYLEGNGGSVIGRELEEQGYLTPRGKTKWSDTTVLGVIKNEKYIGDILMGKTFTVDPITKRRLANFGESDKYHIENHHEPIISREDFEKAQGIRLRRAQNRNTIANKDRKREKLSRQYAFSSMLECGFCGKILSRRTWHTSSIYKKINWQCIRSTKKGKKYCPHSKGIQEAAIEKAFVESYRQLCHADSTVIDDFLKIVEEEINDESLVKDLKKIENQLNRIISQERKLVELHLEDSIDEEVYAKKYKKLTKQKEELLDEKKTLELTIKDEDSIKERLKQFKKILENREIIEEFNRTVFETIVDKVVVGRIDKDGTVHPYDLTFYFKTGVKDSQDSNKFKDKRKNAKDNDINKLCSYKNDEDKKLCSQSKDNAGAMLVDAIAALVFGHIYDKNGVKALVISTIISAPFSLFIFGFNSLPALLFGLALWGIGMGAQESILKAAVTSMVPKKNRATGYGIFECSFGFFWFLGSWLLGVMYSISLPAMIIISIAAQLLAIPLYLKVARVK